MKIQEGRVRYKDSDNIICMYGITDEGKQYYFLTDTKQFSNGNHIASTELVEAIDPMYKASHVGLVSEAGVEVIPCDKKSIKPIQENSDVVLVELAEPVSKSVIEANKLRNDPLFATRLVSTPSTIKEKINSKMGTEGRYVFNDQFSEVTICDINGNNLVNNEYYSFVGYCKNELYLAKNTPETDVVEFSLDKDKVTIPVVDEDKVEEPTTEAVISEAPVENVIEEVSTEPVVSEVTVPTEEIVSEPLGQEITIPEVSKEETNTDFSFDTDIFPEEVIEEENNSIIPEEENVEVEDSETSELDNLFFEIPEKEIDLFEDIKTDKIEDTDEFTIEEKEDSEETKESIMEDVAKSMGRLIKQNRDLKNSLTEANDRNEKLVASKKNATDRVKMLEQKNDALIAKIHGLESNLTKLESRNEILEAKSHDQEKLIDSQKRELDLLHYQLEGKDDVVKVLADAKVLLGNDEEIEEDYYQKVA